VDRFRVVGGARLAGQVSVTGAKNSVLKLMAAAMLANALVLECSVGGRPVELAMSSDAIMGFMSWLEAAPPGQHLVA